MPSSHRRRPAAPSPAQASPTASLRVQNKPERLTALLHAHHRLLAKIKLKRRELERLEERVQSTMAAASSRLQPVTAELAQLDRALHALFAELLERKRQPRSTIAAIKDLYRTLQQSGMMSRRPDADRTAKEKAEDRQRDPGPAEDSAPPSPEDSGGFSARRPDQGTNQSLRTLFRRLAEALHPDKVQQEDEKSRRTEAMKEITRAYQDGDIARLLELERNLLSGQAIVMSDELDRRSAALVQMNAALRVQLDEITGELKALRSSAYAALLQDFTHAAKFSGKDPIDAMVEEARADLARLRELQDFVSAFRDGKIDVSELARGPRLTREPAPDAVDAFLDELFEQTSQATPKRGKKRRRATQSTYPE